MPVGDTDAFVDRLNKLRNESFRNEMSTRARKEAERWGWEAATSVLRNIQYEEAIVNFHSRAFGGFGRARTKGALRLLVWRLRRVLARMRVPGFRNLKSDVV